MDDSTRHKIMNKIRKVQASEDDVLLTNKEAKELYADLLRENALEDSEFSDALRNTLESLVEGIKRSLSNFEIAVSISNSDPWIKYPESRVCKYCGFASELESVDEVHADSCVFCKAREVVRNAGIK